MPSMITLSVTAVPDHLRGALTRWLLEVTPELYVGTVSAKVRDELWAAVTHCTGDGHSVMVYPTANEQGFSMRISGIRRRQLRDFDGLSLVAFNSPPITGQPDQEIANPL
ncbi:type I-E CRISPR-associated endoribonuclease Cas2e [Streptomyces kronopolitis]